MRISIIEFRAQCAPVTFSKASESNIGQVDKMRPDQCQSMQNGNHNLSLASFHPFEAMLLNEVGLSHTIYFQQVIAN